MKKTWEGINEMLYHRKKNLKNISKLKDLTNKGKIVKEASQIPNILNKHFATVGNRLASNLPFPPKHHLDYRIYSLIRRTIFYEKRCLFDENLLKIRGASYNRVFSRNDCVIQTTRLS